MFSVASQERWVAAQLKQPCIVQVSEDGMEYDALRAAPADANLTWLAPSPHARQRATFEGYMLRLADPGAKFDIVWLRCSAQNFRYMTYILHNLACDGCSWRQVGHWAAEVQRLGCSSLRSGYTAA